MSLFLDPKLREAWGFGVRFCSFPIFQAERDGHSYGKARLGHFPPPQTTGVGCKERVIPWTQATGGRALLSKRDKFHSLVVNWSQSGTMSLSLAILMIFFCTRGQGHTAHPALCSCRFPVLTRGTSTQQLFQPPVKLSKVVKFPPFF